MNADNRSYRLNFETMAVFFDPRAAKAVEEMLIPDFARAEKLEKTLRQQNLKIRLGAPFARLLGPLL